LKDQIRFFNIHLHLSVPSSLSEKLKA